MRRCAARVLGPGSSATLTAGLARTTCCSFDGSGKVAASILPTTTPDRRRYRLSTRPPRVRATTLSGLGSGRTHQSYLRMIFDRRREFGSKQITTNATAISGLGTASTKNVGTSALNVVQLDASAKPQPLTGLQLTNIIPQSQSEAMLCSGWDGSTTITISTSANVVSCPQCGRKLHYHVVNRHAVRKLCGFRRFDRSVNIGLRSQ